jgi:hypothetical protein
LILLGIFLIALIISLVRARRRVAALEEGVRRRILRRSKAQALRPVKHPSRNG